MRYGKVVATGAHVDLPGVQAVVTLCPDPSVEPQRSRWRMRNGDLIRICDMTDSHLINAIRMAARNGAAFKGAEVAIAASYGVGEETLSQMMEREVMDYLRSRCRCWDAMLLECRRRGIDIWGLLYAPDVLDAIQRGAAVYVAEQLGIYCTKAKIEGVKE
jgi:hypothetical protein